MRRAYPSALAFLHTDAGKAASKTRDAESTRPLQPRVSPRTGPGRPTPIETRGTQPPARRASKIRSGPTTEPTSGRRGTPRTVRSSGAGQRASRMMTGRASTEWPPSRRRGRRSTPLGRIWRGSVQLGGRTATPPPTKGLDRLQDQRSGSASSVRGGPTRAGGRPQWRLHCPVLASGRRAAFPLHWHHSSWLSPPPSPSSFSFCRPHRRTTHHLLLLPCCEHSRKPTRRRRSHQTSC
mmetsp:Transcript_5819/g.16763  ORF Transcript_5819/g.16763 Transcript_5819/m.16763 type:complete len:237 (+) Transcript_5819:2061-2771(+)